MPNITSNVLKEIGNIPIAFSYKNQTIAFIRFTGQIVTANDFREVNL